MGSVKAGRIVLILALAAVLLFVLSGCGAEQPKQQDTEIEKVAVTVEAAHKGSLQKVTTLSSKIEGENEINVVPKLGGKVEEVPVKVGDRVEAGDVLVRLETRDIRAQLKQAQANLAAATAGYDNAKKNLERMQQLFEQGAVSQQQLDSVRMQYDSAKSGTMEQAQAAVELARSQLDNAVINSPIGGIVAFRYVDPGEMAAPGAPVITVVDMDTVKVTVNVPETEISSVGMGDEVEVEVPAVSTEQPFSGKITMVSPAADPRTKAYPVEVSIDNPEHIIKPGMFAQVSLGTFAQEDVIVILQEAVVDLEGRKVVFTVEGDKAVEQEVTVGITTGEKAAVLDGLAVDDLVVVQGQHRLEHGTPVEVQGGDK